MSTPFDTACRAYSYGHISFEELVAELEAAKSREIQSVSNSNKEHVNV